MTKRIPLILSSKGMVGFFGKIDGSWVAMWGGPGVGVGGTVHSSERFSMKQRRKAAARWVGAVKQERDLSVFKVMRLLIR